MAQRFLNMKRPRGYGIEHGKNEQGFEHDCKVVPDGQQMSAPWFH